MLPVKHVALAHYGGVVVFGRVVVLDGVRLLGCRRLDLGVGVLLPLGLAHDLLLVLLHDLQERVAHASSLREVVLHRLPLHLELGAVLLQVGEDAAAQARLEEGVVALGVLKGLGVVLEEAGFVDFGVHLGVDWVRGDAVEVVVDDGLLLGGVLQVRVAVVFGLEAEHVVLGSGTGPVRRVGVEVLDLGHLRLLDHLVDGVRTQLLVRVQHLHVVVADGGLLLDDCSSAIARRGGLHHVVDESELVEPLLVELLEVGDDCLPLRFHVGADGLTLAIIRQI